ncbi:MAG: MBG domain-containing protein, partial [Chitinophagaceae bacterium]
MRKFTWPLPKFICVLLLICLAKVGKSQAPPVPTLKLTDFAIWGGSASPNSYNSTQRVYLKEKVSIQGNIGSNHIVEVKENFTLTGSILSGNGVSLKENTKITGDIFANKKAANFQGDVISGKEKSNFIGNLVANGKIVLKTGSGSDATKITGKVAVPAPAATNYSGPVPSGGIVTVFTLPVLPVMPNNTPFDSQVGTTNITNTQDISPGKYRNLALTGNKTLTFKGPGNYIFNEVDNGSNSNKFVFDFNNTSAGTISIFIIKDARWGKLSVSTKNGNFPSRIYTEIHGNGTFSFDLQGPDAIPAGSYAWLGNVWAPNGGISIKSLKTSTNPHIIGALWSGKRVDLEENLRLVYQAPAADPIYIDPYYPPPVSGKVNPANNIIGAELFSLFQNPAPINSITENEIFILDNSGKVMIEVVSKTANDNTLKADLIALGMTSIVDNGPHIFVITGFFPINNLPQLNGNARIEYVRPLYPAISNAGQVTTQGDSTMRSHNVRGRFGVDGSGVKIGVISDSYNSKLVAQNDVDQGDLPGIKSGGQLNDNPEPVQVLEDLPQRGNDEGRAMLQIVHDVAPKSKLAFRTGFLTAGHFAKGIQELADPYLAGGPCDVIVDDITYVTEPFLQDGKVAQAVDQVAAQGVTYFSSAGNFGNKSYESVFNGVTNTSVIATGQIHQFGGAAADIYQTVNLKPGSYTIVLQWSDEFHSLGSADGVQTDMDLYLVGANGYTLFGFNRSNLFGDPFEVCPFTVKEETLAKLMVVRAAGINNVRFKYIIFRGDATIQDYPSGTSTIVGHPNANGAIAVGAMLYANFPAFTPVWPGVASFSSRGGTSTLKNNVFTIRNKPELIGPNGVNTTVNLGGAAFNDGDPYPNFFGTSAAAPHAAAVGALLIQGRKKYNLQTSVSPDEIRQQLQSSTGKFSYLPANFSFEGGYGYIQADSAIAQIANARPIISSLEAVVPGAQNGTEPFEVKVKGEYLTSSTEIYYYGEPVTTSVSLDKTEATATVPAIPNGEDPPFQLYNPPKSPSELDGGLSEALHFFSSVIDITVRAENKSRKYGQNNPVFSVEILYNGVPVNHPDTLAKLKLDGNNLSFNTIATLASNAGLYGIFPSRSTPLEGNDPLITQYGFTFVSGTLSVGKMPLTITPDNKTVYSGEDPGEITYEYALDQSDATSPTLPDEVRALHKKYLADNALMVLNDFNNQNLDFSNMSIMASFQAVRNARKFHLENGQLFPLRGDLDPTELGRQRFIVDASATSLQNYQLDPAQSYMVPAFPDGPARAFLNIKALSNGTAKAAVPNGQLQPMVNGQLMAMVNGQLQAIVNGQLQALVNGQLMPLVNGQLVAMVNGQLQPLVNGQLLAMVNGQLMALVNGELQLVQDLTLSNGQLQALVNGQLQPLVNGQLQAMVNGVVTDIPNADVNLVNGQLQAIVNGQLQALVNGQLQALVNGQLQPLVNGDAVSVESVIQLANGQLQALVNGTYIPITNGQLQALVNGQLLAMVNGQLMAIVNGEVTFTVFQNGQLQALVNGQLQPLVNGQLQAIVNGQLQALVNSESPVDNSYRIVNGQLQAIVNGQTWAYANGQLLALVNGQLQPLINNFDVSGPNNNANTLVLVDEDDINLQAGGIGGMFSMNMITGSDTGTQHLVPGAFVNENFEVTYGLGEVTIITKPTLTVSADNKTKIQGEPNPPLTLSYEGFLNGDDENTICSGDFVPAYTVPASPVSIEQLFRVTTYTNVALNNGTNVVTVSPGATVTLTGNRSSISQAISENQCPGCVTQHYIGIRDVFSDCFDANGSSGVLNHTFKAPKIPGVYYITQVASWEYNCFDNGQGNPDNDPENAIAVVIVEGINKMYAATSASTISPADGYPITLSGCTDPTNYNVVFNDGILTIQEDPCLERHWDANRTYTDRMSGAAGIATGGVHNLGPGKVGGVSTWNGYYNQNNSFSFDGTGYIETGTAGSVSGTDDFSVSAWVQTTSNDPMVIINQRGSDNDVFGSGFYGGYILKIGGAHSDSTPNSNAGKAYFLIFDLNNNPNLVDLFSTTLVNDGNWHHIKAERRGTSINLYVDGNLEATASTPGAVYLNGAIPTYIGA